MQSVTSRRHATGRRSPIGLATRLKCPPSFSLRETVLSHGWYELVPFRWEDASSTLYRAEVLPDGSLHYFSLRQPGRLGRSIQIRWLTGDPAKEPKSILIARIRRILNLDLDLAPFLSLCRREPRLRYVPRRGSGRIRQSGSRRAEAVPAIGEGSWKGHSPVPAHGVGERSRDSGRQLGNPVLPAESVRWADSQREGDSRDVRAIRSLECLCLLV